ncbi:transcriptional regulator [Betaproteobacteria bacterium]|nr:transcriptional regulator [Betaproteobacteria bacterium]
MNLTYKILWLDNDLQNYIDNGSVKSVEDFLSERGFEPVIEKVFDEANLDTALSKYNYDLIISDYNLERTTGDVIIDNIRNIKRLDTEILFYTAQSSYKTKPEVKERLAFIERLTFQIGRDTLLDKIEKVIFLTLQKLLELNATRGLITAATSDLDVEIEEIVMLIKNQQNIDEDKLKKNVNDKVFKPLQKRLDKFWENYSSFQEYFNKMDAVKKWEIFRDLLKPLSKDNKDIASLLETNESYQDDVIELRNKFAHAKAEEKEGKMVLRGQFGKEPFEFDEAKCIEIRKNLILHKRNIYQLKSILIDETV